MKYEYEWLPTSRAALALGRSADTLKRKRDIQGGFLEQGYHYCFGDSPNSPITWHIERCIRAFNKKGIAARKELSKRRKCHNKNT